MDFYEIRATRLGGLKTQLDSLSTRLQEQRTILPGHINDTYNRHIQTLYEAYSQAQYDIDQQLLSVLSSLEQVKFQLDTLLSQGTMDPSMDTIAFIETATHLDQDKSLVDIQYELMRRVPLNINKVAIDWNSIFSKAVERSKCKDPQCVKCTELFQQLGYQKEVRTPPSQVTTSTCWKCTSCAYEYNLKGESKCTRCSKIDPALKSMETSPVVSKAPQPANSSQTTKIIPKVESEPGKTGEKTRTCEQCTLVYGISKKKCPTCLALNPTAPPEEQKASPPAQKIAPKALGNRWKCEKCGHANRDILPQCLVCGNEKKTLVLPKPRKVEEDLDEGMFRTGAIKKKAPGP